MYFDICSNFSSSSVLGRSDGVPSLVCRVCDFSLAHCQKLFDFREAFDLS